MTTQAVECKCNCQRASLVQPSHTHELFMPSAHSAHSAHSVHPTHFSHMLNMMNSTPVPLSSSPSASALVMPSHTEVENALKVISSHPSEQSMLANVISHEQMTLLMNYSNTHNSSDIINFLHSLTAEQATNIINISNGLAPKVASTQPVMVAPTYQPASVKPTSANFASALKSFGVPFEEPEPFASLIDVMTASMYLEKAIHDKGMTAVPAVVMHLDKVKQFLGYAEKYFQAAGATSMVTKVKNVITALDGLIMKVNSKNFKTSQLSKFQSQILYPFQGVLGKLYSEVESFRLNSTLGSDPPSTVISPVYGGLGFGHASATGNAHANYHAFEHASTGGGSPPPIGVSQSPTSPIGVAPIGVSQSPTAPITTAYA